LYFEADCRTTAMGIMPHKDISKALKLVLSLDIPFWPQLPQISFFEDMYVQFSQHFPGISVDPENKKLHFDSARFESELVDYSLKMENAETFVLSQEYSVVYRRFLAENLGDYLAIRGQLIGPVSFGFRVTDENDRPLIYNEAAKTILFDFIQRKINAQFHELSKKNENAFVWLDEPGLGWVFSGLSGYSDVQAKADYQSFLGGVESIKSLHLCANVNLPYLLAMGTELLSFDAYQMELMPKGYANSIADFINRGGILCWGIIPTDSTSLETQTPEILTGLLTGYWKVVSENTGISLRQIARQALIAPARCCLKNICSVGASDDIKIRHNKGVVDLSVEEQVVEKAFAYLHLISDLLRSEFNL
jgi:hypothetical protein